MNTVAHTRHAQFERRYFVGAAIGIIVVVLAGFSIDVDLLSNPGRVSVGWCLELASEKRTMKAQTVFFAAALILTGGCGRASFDAARESQKLLHRDAEWADTAAAGKDVEKIVSYWSDDALVVEPSQPVYEGKAAIRAYVIASLKTPGFKIHWVSEKPVFSADGTMAWMRGADEITVPGPNGALMTLHQRGISIWRRDPDGVWRGVVDIANESAPPATVSDPEKAP